MRDKLQIMVFVLILVCIVTGLVFLIDKSEESYKYKISDGRGNLFKTNNIEYMERCIEFKTICCEELTRVCGTYTIKENKNYNNK
jgi:hypothetical protein